MPSNEDYFQLATGAFNNLDGLLRSSEQINSKFSLLIDFLSNGDVDLANIEGGVVYGGSDGVVYDVDSGNESFSTSVLENQAKQLQMMEITNFALFFILAALLINVGVSLWNSFSDKWR